jgi:lipopolysaccharide transport system permease protein
MTAAPPTGVRDAGIVDFTPARTMSGRLRGALRDLREATALWRLCWTLSWLDIRLRYRGSMLGPFWLTLSTGIMVGSMGVIYGTLFHMNLREYLPFLAVSQVLWAFLAVLVNDSCAGYTGAEGLIRAVRLPYALYAARIVLRNLVVLAHNLLVIVVVFVVMRVWPGTAGLMMLPALALWLADALAITVLLGAVCARFRDIPPIVSSVMQMAFFVTPVIWRPEQAGTHQWLLAFNPLYTLLEIMRGPLLGSIPGATVYGVAIGSSMLLWAASLLLFARVRGRIAFWV